MVITFQWGVGWTLEKYHDSNLPGLHLVWYLSSDYSNQGVDQLQKVIEMIKTNPDDRRIIMCAWNPKGIEQQTLSECSCTLSCCMLNYVLILCQQSVPFGVLAYSL